MRTDNLTESQIPVILGLDQRESAWTLWHRYRGDYNLQPPKKTLAQFIHSSVLEWVEENAEYIFNAPARRAKGPAQRVQEIPLQTTPDLVILEQPAYGNGYGGVTVSHITYRQWRKYWHPGSFAPKPPAWVNAAAQASMMASKAEWHAVLPVIGIDNPKAPLILEPDLDLQKEIQRHVVDFFRSVQNNEPPPPDYKAGRDIMNMLAKDSASRKQITRNPAPLPDEKAQELRPMIERYEDLISKHAKSSDDASNIRQAIQDIEVIFAETVATHGPFNLDGHSVNVRSEDRQPVIHEPVTSVYVERDPIAESGINNQI